MKCVLKLSLPLVPVLPPWVQPLVLCVERGGYQSNSLIPTHFLSDSAADQSTGKEELNYIPKVSPGK